MSEDTKIKRNRKTWTLYSIQPKMCWALYMMVFLRTHGVLTANILCCCEWIFVFLFKTLELLLCITRSQVLNDTVNRKGLPDSLECADPRCGWSYLRSWRWTSHPQETWRVRSPWSTDKLPLMAILMTAIVHTATSKDCSGNTVTLSF